MRSEIQEAIISYFNQTLSKTEADILLSWVNDDPENRKYFHEIYGAWISQGMYREITTDPDKALSEIKKRINDRGYRTTGVRFIKIRLRSLIRIAAAAIILLAAFGITLSLVFLDGKTSMEASMYFEAVAPKGSRSFITMTDSTSIWLNAGTKLRYNTGYGITNRDVYLEGEAYFEVKKNQEYQFRVITSHTSITALGTTFNVKSYPEESTIETTLEEGMVELEILNGTNLLGNVTKVILNPNQTAVLDKKGSSSMGPAPQFVIVPVDDIKAYTSWKDDKWIIKNERMSLLAPKLERRFNVKVVFRDEDLKEYMITATFEDESLEQVLEAMRLVMPLKFEVDDNVVYLSEDEALWQNFKNVLMP